MKLAIQSYNFQSGGDWDKINTTEEAEHLLEQIREAGFDGIEWCSFMLDKEGLDLKAIKQKMDAIGLKTCGMHYHCWDPKTLEETCAVAASRCKLFESKYLIFAFSVPKLFGIEPSVSEKQQKGAPQDKKQDTSGKEEVTSYTPEQIDQWAKEADRVLAVMKKAVEGTDIRVLYHNHAEEFRKGSAGQYFLDLIHPDAREMDVYWTAKGLDGKVASALEYIRTASTPTTLLHMKDGLNGSRFPGEMCGWGKGTYPLQDIVDFGKELGIEWVVAENDAPLNFGTNGIQDARETGAFAKDHIRLQ